MAKPSIVAAARAARLASNAFTAANQADDASRAIHLDDARKHLRDATAIGDAVDAFSDADDADDAEPADDAVR